MRILICTYKRPTRQTTWNSLPASLRERTTLVVQYSEREAYPGLPILVLPDYIQNIRQTRRWLIDNTVERDDKIVMLDDDLVFAVRREDDPTKFNPAEDIDVERLFYDIDYRLDSYAHVGVSGREGANRRTEAWLEVGRQMRVLAYRLDIMSKEKIMYDIEFMEDFHVTLQLLEKGYPNLIINWMVHNQGGSNTAGGCSEHRTLEKQGLAAEALHRMHPEFVKVVEKQTKTAWGGQKRKDVIIQWQKAYKSADTYPDIGPPTGGEADNL